MDLTNWNEDIIDQVHGLFLERFSRESIRNFDSIFASSDLAAIGAYHALADLECRIPEDVMVCGFDDMPVAKEIRPRLTSVAQPIALIARSAFDLLLTLRRGTPLPDDEKRIAFRPHIVARESTVKT